PRLPDEVQQVLQVVATSVRPRRPPRGAAGVLAHHSFLVSTRPLTTEAISSNGNMKSATPVATAASGMLLNSAVAGSCTMTVPPCILAAVTPVSPSLPEPVNTHAMVRFLQRLATDSKRTSAAGRTKWTRPPHDSEKSPPAPTVR